MTDELDQAHADLRAHIGESGPQNFTDTQGFIATTQVWTLTEAAELLAAHTDPETVATWTGDDRLKALADIVGHLIRQSLTVSPIRDELMAGAPKGYSGRTALDSGQVPAVFDALEEPEDNE